MAKFERHIPGSYDFDEVLTYLHKGIVEGSWTAEYEAGSEYRAGEVRCAVRVYERYSLSGGNRVSLTVMLAGQGDKLFLSGIAAAGSQAAFKVCGWGEDEFLARLKVLADQLTG